MRCQMGFLPVLILIGLVCAAGPVAADHHRDGECATAERKDIVATAAEAGQFETLLAAAKAAGLVEALQGEGPLTLFAPTDAAFGKLPEGTIPALLEDKEKLAAILTYHVVAGKVTAKQVVELSSAETLAGKEVSIRVEDGHVKINESTVIQADIMASNGVIHVIDTVLLPQ